ncbi:hypothetical protein [Oceanirhabdus sp. W0125-5]|uniref:hypothetical protein n=1 Tax=Oceanirhabdus sp. W0125-5 TaxID=2999116 RepID=UPI0022F2CCE4|nr:hypothetical protein [Oceanirhabdus sp. W0125-5]WBW99129.1 hypothetical protein OW730_10390 [Oceanirhabdus sp. W0125-5]
MEIIKCPKCNGELEVTEYKARCWNRRCNNEESIVDIIASYYENKEFNYIIELSDDILSHVWVEESCDKVEGELKEDKQCEEEKQKVFRIKSNDEKKIIADILYFNVLALVNIKLYEKANEMIEAAINIMQELRECGFLEDSMKLARLLIYRGTFYRNMGQIIWCTEDYGIALEIMEEFINKEDIDITKKYTELLIERGVAFEEFEMLEEALEQYIKAYDIRVNLVKRDIEYLDEYLSVCHEVVKVLDLLEEYQRIIKYVEEMDELVEGKNIIDEGEKSIIEINKIMIKAEEQERKRVAKELKKEKGNFFSKIFKKKS